jgi:hypothetical protein
MTTGTPPLPEPHVPLTRVHCDGQTEAGRTIEKRYMEAKETGVKANIVKVIREEERMSHIERFGAGNPAEMPLRIREFSPYISGPPPRPQDSMVVWKVVR